MKSKSIDLTNCDKEPIHLPGKIQSHGFFLAVNRQSLIITCISENINNFIDLSAVSLLGLSLTEFERLAGLTDQKNQLSSLLKTGETSGSFETINPYVIAVNGNIYHLIISVSAAVYLMEFEPVILFQDIQNQIGKSAAAILSSKDLQSLLRHTVNEVKDIIHYDRIMIYKFLEDGHGEVIAEAKNEELEPLYGLHYPASDIPKQARELYKLNYTRIIADVDTQSSVVLTKEAGVVLDLTHSVLRAVSPIHIQYLKNMGVKSSFSISLICNGELWGLIACHNYTPKFIDYKAREASKLIGQIVSSSLMYKEEGEHVEQRNTYLKAMSLLDLHLEKEENIVTALSQQKYTVKDVTSATGAAILFENKLTLIGETPDHAQLDVLFDWLNDTMEEAVYSTSSLPEVFPPSKQYKEISSGIIACRLSKELKELIVWFKPEQITTINWAGDPNKPVLLQENGEMFLSPRNSFEIWSETVEQTSLDWTKSELSNVSRLRTTIIDTFNKKAVEVRLLNERLKLAYEELDTFSYTISHDLRTPLTSIKSYTELVISANKSLDEKGKMLLSRVVAGANKMEFLINEILSLAKVGRADLKFVKLDMDLLVKEIATEVISSLSAERLVMTFGDLPFIHGDHTLIMQLFTNIISNAIKYSAGVEQPEVNIEGMIEDDEVIYRIQDNGIGIKAENYERIFELFSRMDNVKNIEGTGVGLAIVKRIVEKHNARIWFDSELNAGTVFYIAFKR